MLKHSSKAPYLLATVASCWLSLSGAIAGDAVANRSAYDAALKCFVADGLVIGDFRKAGDAKSAAVFDAKAHASFNAALKLGAMLGYSNDRIDADIDIAQSVEMPRMVKDASYYRAAASDCKAMGLM